MYFKRIEMHGFKSFAEPVVIDFHEGITCIVGPNGSGKSNISDAIRWVLGEQSPKTLRGGKMEDVIFAGTASRKSRGMAEVTLVIDNKTGILPIDFAEVAITRKMYRSGESEYSINNTQCRLKDIRELIMDTGIGVDGYSLIGQGKIADIVANKSEARREIFEEAAGIVKYRSKKAEAERKLESANGNLERVNDIIGELEGRIDTLKDESTRAREFLQLKESLKDLEINLTLKNVESVELKNEYIKDEISEAAVQIDEWKAERQSLEERQQEQRQRNEELEAQERSVRDRILICVEQMNALINESQLNQEKLSTLQKDHQRLEEEIRLIQEKKEKEQANLAALDQQIQAMTEEARLAAEGLDQELREQAAEAESLNRYNGELEQKKNDLYQLHHSVATKTAEKKSLENLYESLKKREETLNLQQEEGLSGDQELARDHDRISLEIDEMSRNLSQWKGETSDLREQEIRERKEGEALGTLLEELKLEIGQAASRKKTIEEMESNYEGYNGGVRTIMKSGLSGIHGVVGELIQVPEGYETAIETGLGAGLQNIICEDDQSARKAIELLKSSKGGRLTFLPVKSIKAQPLRKEPAISQGTGFLGYATECIQYDSRYQTIMEYLLGRVVLVDHLENAIQLSRKSQGNYRFVTLEGEIINMGGAITGGATKYKSASLLERKAEITSLENLLRDKNRERTQIVEKLENQKNNLRKLAEDLEKKVQQLQETEITLLQKTNEAKVLKSKLEGLAEAKQKWLREQADLQNEMAEMQRLIGESEEGVSALRSRIQELEQEIEASMEILDQRRNQLKEKDEAIVKARLQLQAMESQRNSTQSIGLRIRETLEDLQQQLRIKEETLAGLLREKDRLSTGDVNMEDIVAEKEEEKKSLEKYQQELMEERAGLTASLNQMYDRRSSLEEELAVLQTKKYDLEIRQAKNDTLLESYKERLWEEYEVTYIKAMEFRKKDFNMGAATRESREIKGRIKELGDVNVGSIREYESVRERFDFLSEQRSDILEAVDSLKKIIGDMDKIIRARFKESFDQVVENFESVFQELFGGGQAQLLLEDETRPLESGIEIIAQPPGKKLQNLNLLSGGEKTMTAIALMFAVLKAKPTPFCILDEVEAALDDANIDRFAGYLRNYENVQFALVTHQKATMEHADVLYGVTMPEQGISKVLSLRLGDKIEM